MWQEDRHQRIRAMLATFGRVSAERMAADLGVSRETVRRDLLDLELAGALRRVRGGAVSLGDEPEPPIAVRVRVRVREKRAIARAAAARCAAGQTLFLDAGSTTTLLAEELAGYSGLSVITNSVDIALLIGGEESRGRGNDVLLLGGRMLDGLSATCGATTVAEIHRFRADLALLSPVGFDVRYGATSFDPREADVARAMADNARTVAILADHAKIGTPSRISYRSTDRVDILVTDAEAAENPSLAAIRDKVGEVVLAS